MSLSFLFSCLSYLEYKLPFPLQHIFWYLRYLECSSSSHVDKLVVSSTSHEMTALASKSNSLSLTVLPHSCYITPVHLPSHFNRRKSHHRNPLPQLQKYFLPFFELKSSLFLARLPQLCSSYFYSIHVIEQHISRALNAAAKLQCLLFRGEIFFPALQHT